MAKTYNFQQIASTWIVKNNRTGVINALTENRLIANTGAGTSMTDMQLTSILYNYYLKNGGSSFANLLRQIPLNENLSQSEIASLENASSDIRAVLNIAPVQRAPVGAITTQDFKSSVSQFWDLIVGGSETTVQPTVTTTTKTSPLTVGLIIGGVAVLAIIAYVIVK